MKCTSTISLSLLLLGVCYARNIDSERTYEKDDSMKSDEERYRELERSMRGELKDSENDGKSMQQEDYRREDKDRRDDKEYREGEKGLPSLDDLKDMLTHKVSDVYNKLAGNNDNSQTFYFEDMPNFADPLQVGSVVDEIASVRVEYKNAVFNGLSTAYHGSVKVDTASNSVVLTINLKNVSLSGEYVTFSTLKQSSGAFNIDLSGNVAYIQHYRYRLENGEIQMEKVSGEIQYNDIDSHYENIGFFAQFIQKTLGKVLLETVSDQITHEIHPKLYNKVQGYVFDVTQQHSHGQSEKALKESINKAVNGIQQVLAKSGAASIELTNDDNEMVFRQLHAKISSVSLHGLEKMYLADNEVSYDDDKVRAKIQLAIRKPTATAIFSIHKSHDENAAFQKLYVDFDMDRVYADLGLEKQAGASGMQLRAINAHAAQVKPMDAERYDAEVCDLLKDRMSTHVQNYIERGLKNFIQNKLAPVVTQGVWPRYIQQKYDASPKRGINDKQRFIN